MRLKVFVYRILESCLDTLETFCGDMKEAVALCPACGQNRYTGAPCWKDGLPLCRKSRQ